MNQIKINIPEGYEIDFFNKETGEVTFKKIEHKYPISVMDIPDRTYYLGNTGRISKSLTYNDLNQVSTIERAEALLALAQLSELRDAWNKIDNFKADFIPINNYQNKYCIEISQGNILKETYKVTKKILYFGSEKTRDLFLKTFENLIKQAKEFL